MPDPGRVRAMFGRIAPRYDLLNRVLSLGVDRRWRSRSVAQAGDVAGRIVVDACCGTGDLALAFAERGACVLGIDFTPEMLARACAAKALRRGGYVQGDALRLPVADGSADVASIAFGLRNVQDRKACLEELARVVRPGGLVLVLEFGMPSRAWLATPYRFYFTRVLPWLGGLVSGDHGAYRYLPETVLAWPSARALCGEMASLGLVEPGYRALSGGIAYLHWGRVPGASAAEPRIG
jgi:demethylmenaquinone methyltransferase/2-methoxy-6-polyprenyl-1,4-benzoquinol methylase